MMASSSLVMGLGDEFYDPEFARSIVITQRTLSNIEKGRERSQQLLTDADYAFRIQSEYLENALRVIEDARIANLVNEGVEVADSPSGVMLDNGQTAAAYRRAELSIAARDGLPGPSTVHYDVPEETGTVLEPTSININSESSEPLLKEYESNTPRLSTPKFTLDLEQDGGSATDYLDLYREVESSNPLRLLSGRSSSMSIKRILDAEPLRNFQESEHSFSDSFLDTELPQTSQVSEHSSPVLIERFFDAKRSRKSQVSEHNSLTATELDMESPRRSQVSTDTEQMFGIRSSRNSPASRHGFPIFEEQISDVHPFVTPVEQMSSMRPSRNSPASGHGSPTVEEQISDVDPFMTSMRRLLGRASDHIERPQKSEASGHGSPTTTEQIFGMGSPQNPRTSRRGSPIVIEQISDTEPLQKSQPSLLTAVGQVSVELPQNPQVSGHGSPKTIEQIFDTERLRRSRMSEDGSLMVMEQMLEQILSIKPPRNSQVTFQENSFAVGTSLTSSIVDDRDDLRRNEEKGKKRAEEYPSDEEYALKLQSQYLDEALQIVEDAEIAKTLDQGLEVVHPSSNTSPDINHVADALRRAALRIAARDGLPGPSTIHQEQGLKRDLEFASINTTESIIEPSESQTPRLIKIEGVETTDISNKDTNLMEGASSILRRSSPSFLCIICEEYAPSMDYLRTPCDHIYCRQCIISFVDASTRDDSMLPLRCCSQPIPSKSVIPFLTVPLLSFFEAKLREVDIPLANRVYCPTPDCTTLLGSSRNLNGNIICPKCRSSICSLCLQPPHPGESCSDNAGILEVRTLARVEHWQTCPGCNAIVELHQGCYHMTCRCKTQFCYLCAALWKQCDCPQWEERRL